jgi:hypothetical protein
VKFNDAEKFKEAKEALKYFVIDDCQVRSLPFDKDFTKVNRDKLTEKNVFIKKIPEDMTN